MTHPAFWPGETDVLRLMLRQVMARPAAAPWQQLDGRQHFAARATYFVLDWRAPDDPETFIVLTLARLVCQLVHRTEQRPVESEGGLRGRVLWPATIKARYGRDYNPNRLVYREVRHAYDTLENQLLKFVMERLRGCLLAVPAPLRAGATLVSGGEATVATAQRLARMETALAACGRAAALRDISLPASVTEDHLAQAESARMEEYGAVARLYRCYRAVVAQAGWGPLAKISRRVLPLPGRAGGEGEPWIRFAAALLANSN